MSDWAAQEAALFGGGAPPRAAPRSEAAARRQFVGDVSGDESFARALVAEDAARARAAEDRDRALARALSDAPSGDAALARALAAGDGAADRARTASDAALARALAAEGGGDARSTSDAAFARALVAAEGGADPRSASDAAFARALVASEARPAALPTAIARPLEEPPAAGASALRLEPPSAWSDAAAETLLETAAAALDARSSFADDAFPPRPVPCGDAVAADWARGSRFAPRSGPWGAAGGPRAADVKQGRLGTCWLLSAAAVLAASDAATVATLFPGQPHAANKRGCYVVRLCCFGLWRLVVVDDLLPTLRGRPCFAGVDGALWPALVEKAAAKVYGGYELLSGGHVRSALALLTGWPCGDHSLDLHDAQGGSVEDARDVLWLTLLSLVEARAVCCASARTDASRLNAVGLNQRHAYSVVDVVELTDLGGTVSRLVRLRDPHGDALQRSWAGDWSAADLARRPRELGDALRARGAPDPSTQWLSFADLERYFSRVSFCEDRSAWAGDLRAAARAGSSVAAAGTPCLAVRSRARAPAAVCLERPRADGPDACVLVLRASRRALRRGRCGADAVTGVHAVASAAVAGGAATALGTWVGGGDDDLVHVVAPLCFAPSAVDVNLAVLSRDALDAAPAVLEPAALAAALRQLARGDDNPRYFHGLRLSAAKCGLATLLVASNANASDTATVTLEFTELAGCALSRGAGAVCVVDVVPPRTEQLLCVVVPTRPSFRLAYASRVEVARFSSVFHDPPLRPGDELHRPAAYG